MSLEIKRIDPNPRSSSMVIYNNTIYLVNVGDDPKASVADQTRQLLAKVDKKLASVGSGKSKLLSTTIWLADMDDFDEMNKVWDAWIDPGNPPSRACGQAKLAKGMWKVEMIMVAAT